MTDRVMQHGRSLAGLAPSTYEATLATTLAIGYPTGSLMPLGVGHQLLAYDSAWLYQPYLAFLAAMLALTLYAVLEGTIPSRPRARSARLPRGAAGDPLRLRALGRDQGARGRAAARADRGAAAVDARAQARAARRAPARRGVRDARLRPQPAGRRLARGAAARRRRSSCCAGIRRARCCCAQAGSSAALAVLAIPAFVAAVDWLPKIGAFDKETNLGNLIGPLSGWQLFGIWPVGDFRSTRTT